MTDQTSEPTNETSESSDDTSEPTNETSESSDDTSEPSEEEVVQTASAAAEGIVLDRYKQSQLRDFDVTVRFEEGVLEVDVYVNPPPEADRPADEVANEAARTAREAVDELFDE